MIGKKEKELNKVLENTKIKRRYWKKKKNMKDKALTCGWSGLFYLPKLKPTHLKKGFPSGVK